MDQSNINLIGLDENMSNAARNFPGMFIARVSAAHRGMFQVLSVQGELLAEISGKLRGSMSYPVVGDFVMIDRESDSEGHAVIHVILPRRTLFTRQAAGTGHELQHIAANIDRVFICMALVNDYNLRRLERYLTAAWESGALPLIVLTKADLCDEVEIKFQEVRGLALGVEVIVVSGRSGEGIETLSAQITHGSTCAFIGSSGIGKTTLINALLGSPVLATGAVRSDGKGRHTTTRRELFALPNGAWVLDTPGMRELGLERGDLDKAFADITELGWNCHFRDCSHTSEPGCAVLEAIREGGLTQGRLASYHKLQKELGYEGLNSRQIESRKLDQMLADFGGVKNANKYIKEKNRQRGR